MQLMCILINRSTFVTFGRTDQATGRAHLVMVRPGRSGRGGMMLGALGFGLGRYDVFGAQWPSSWFLPR